MFRLLILGSDRWACRDLAMELLAGGQQRHPAMTIVHDNGGAVAWAFDQAARFLGLPVENHRVIRQPGQPWPGFIQAQTEATERMIDRGADLCIVLDPLLPPGKPPFTFAQRAVRAGINSWWIDHSDGFPKRLYDSPSLRIPRKPSFEDYWSYDWQR